MPAWDRVRVKALRPGLRVLLGLRGPLLSLVTGVRSLGSNSRVQGPMLAARGLAVHGRQGSLSRPQPRVLG